MHFHGVFCAGIMLAGLGLLLSAVSCNAPAPPLTTPSSTLSPTNVVRLKIWDKTPGVVAGAETDANPTEPTIDLYLPAGKTNVAAVVVLPGGGYTNLAMGHEGAEVGKFFASNNVAALVVRYRHAPRYSYPVPLLDAQRALRFVRAKAAEFHIDPNKVGIMGFSAGGHLAAMTSTLYDNKLLPAAPYTPDAIDGLSARPDFSILMYPVIDLTDAAVTHMGSRTALTQNNAQLYEALSPQKHITKDTPPVFLVHGTNDRAVPVMNSLLYYEACLKAGVPAEMHILENGPHGFGIALTGANAADEGIRSWPDTVLRWMRQRKLVAK